MSFPFLIEDFLAAMNEIGEYGFRKYGADSFEHRSKAGLATRHMERTQSDAIAAHAAEHFAQYLRGEAHDHFGTKRHQLAAVAFNAMMEFYFSEAEQTREVAA